MCTIPTNFDIFFCKVILYWTCPCLEEMIFEKPSWINHEGLQIFSIDIQTGGLRFATGGGDQKVSSVFPPSTCFES